ncbi:L-threonine ammonia-lyase-like [Pocillopora verrucosa]|uniref:L-threonine ammonia-lyase-like n=1 Tax=Pocillopora verrucosa TaxID=203993 RepID=UPI00333ED94E
MEECQEELALTDIYMARVRMKKRFRPTPCLTTCFGVDFGIDVFVKEENLSPTGSYFDRAVLNSLLVLPEDQKRRGVITASECRPFIRALFYYGPKLGIPVTVVVPLGSEIQQQLLSKPGKNIVSCGSDLDEAKRCAEELRRGVRLEYIDSDHSLTMLAGLGTLGFEILEQCDCNLDAVVVPGSDANLLRALRYSIKRIFPQIKVMGVKVKEKESARDSNDALDNTLEISDVHISRTVLRVLEKKGFLLTTEGVSGMAAFLTGKLTQLRNGRVVVVFSES